MLCIARRRGICEGGKRMGHTLPKHSMYGITGFVSVSGDFAFPLWVNPLLVKKLFVFVVH